MNNRTLSSICKITMGQAPKSSSYNDKKQGYPLLAGAGDLGLYLPKPTKYSTEPTKLSSKGDIILCIRATIGDLNYSDQDYCLGRGVAGLRPIPGVLDTQFLWHYLLSAKRNLQKNARGSTFKQISRDDIANLQIPYPPLVEQKRIATILDKANSILKKQQQVITELEKLLEATFQDIFGDPTLNPKKWKCLRLDECTKISSGVTKGKDLAGKNTVFVPYMRVANVQDGYISLSEVKKIEVLPSEVEKYLLKDGDILLTEGGDPDKLGRGAVWENKISPCIHQNHIFKVRVDASVLEPYYLCFQIGSQRGKRFFLKSAKQTTGIATINKTQLNSYPTLVPPIELQRDFCNFYRKINALKIKYTLLMQESESLFNSLIQQAFNGAL